MIYDNSQMVRPQRFVKTFGAPNLSWLCYLFESHPFLYETLNHHMNLKLRLIIVSIPYFQ